MIDTTIDSNVNKFLKTEHIGKLFITDIHRTFYGNRNSVSNKTSAVINQATGVVVGAILIFLALYINFQDNTHDILILNLLGHSIKTTRKLLINVHLPVLWGTFMITLIPAIILANAIQKSLSILQTTTCRLV